MPPTVRAASDTVAVLVTLTLLCWTEFTIVVVTVKVPSSRNWWPLLTV